MSSDNEGSIVVSARVNVKKLAELDSYMCNQGYNVRSMSQLVGWSIDLLCSILEANGLAKEMTLAEANRRMEVRELYQKSNKKRSFMKLGTAMRFESMREEGVDPSKYAPSHDKIINRSNAVQPLPEGLQPYGTNEDWEKAKKANEDEKYAAYLKQKEEDIQRMKDSGMFIDPDKPRQTMQTQEQAVINQKISERRENEAKASMNKTSWEREIEEKDYLKRLNAPPEQQLINKGE